MELTYDVLDRAEALQKEQQAFIAELKSKNPDLTYEAAQSVFFLMKIAELEAKINRQAFPTITPEQISAMQGEIRTF